MDAGISIIAFGVFWALVGAVFSLLILIPPIRRRATQHPRIAIGIMSVATFVITFLSVSYLTAYVTAVFSSIQICDFGDCLPAEKTALTEGGIQEIWKRLIIPPSNEAACYSNDAEICQVVDDALRVSQSSGLMPFIVIGLISATSCGLLVRRFTQDPDKKKKNEEVLQTNSPHP